MEWRIMGSGKTTDAIERMKCYIKINQKFIYVTPFISEYQRIINELGVENIKTPMYFNELDYIELNLNKNNEIDILNPLKKYYKLNNKSDSFIKLTHLGKNIATTHALYTNLNIENIDSFKDYVLIIDEAINPISIFKVGNRDLEILFNENLIEVNSKTQRVIMVDDSYKDDSFSALLNFCKQEEVYLQQNSFISLFPVEIFKSFKKVEILTYSFESNLMAAYFKLKNIKYSTTNKKNELERKKVIKENLNIHNGSRNQKPGTKETSFSKNHLMRSSTKSMEQIKRSTEYIFRYVFKTKSAENTFTTFKDVKKKLAGNSYTKNFIPVNSRATNEFSHIKSMAYLANRYMNPEIKNFFLRNDVDIDEDQWALSELLQWVWRGCIRNGEPMNLYIPNTRMRKLLNQWLNNQL